MRQQIIIIGAGPGGLTAAHALLARGFRVRVLEQSPKLSRAGAGLLLQVNAGRILAQLGLWPSLQRAGIELHVGRIETLTGQCLVDGGYAQAAKHYGLAHLSILRRRVLDLMHAGLPKGTVAFAKSVCEVIPRTATVEVRCQDGTCYHGGLVIGCDGIHSTIRQQLFGPVKFRTAGYRCWRGLFRHQGVEEAALFERWHRGLRLGSLPVDEQTSYIFATAKTKPSAQPAESFVDDFRRRFACFSERVPWALESAPVAPLHCEDIREAHPPPSWRKGRVALLGDAAHQMTPNLGQGACQAIEDAVVLADCLARRTHDMELGLKEYEEERRPRVTKIAEASWRFGQLAGIDHPWACAVRDALLTSAERWAGPWMRRQHAQMVFDGGPWSEALH